jgi:hypothetical protein
MNKQLKAKWIKALRSGQYRRGVTRLVSEDGKQFCCLGVLADVQGCIWQETRYGNLKPIMPRGQKTFSSNSADNDDGEYLKPSKAGGLPLAEQVRLAKMNDGGATFKKIADYIEKNL